MKIGGNSSYKPPGPSQTAQRRHKPEEDQVFWRQHFEKKIKIRTTICGRAYFPICLLVFLFLFVAM